MLVALLKLTVQTLAAPFGERSFSLYLRLPEGARHPNRHVVKLSADEAVRRRISDA
jgi:hypothetical protein